MSRLVWHHAREGFYFARLPDGSVRIQLRHGKTIVATLTLPEADWAAVVEAVAHREAT